MEPNGCWPGHTYRMEGEVDMWAASGNGSLPPDGQPQLRPKKKDHKNTWGIFCSCVHSKSAFLWNKLIFHKGKQKAQIRTSALRKTPCRKFVTSGFRNILGKTDISKTWTNRKSNESQCYIAFKCFFICDVNVTILKPKVYFLKNVLCNIPAS